MESICGTQEGKLKSKRNKLAHCCQYLKLDDGYVKVQSHSLSTFVTFEIFHDQKL